MGMVVVAAFAANARRRRQCRDQVHSSAHKIGRQCGQSIVVAIGPTVLDRRILALDIAGFAQAPMESGYAGGECYS